MTPSRQCWLLVVLSLCLVPACSRDDDAVREFAYDRTDKLQQFDKGWDEAVARGWTVVSMKNDWKTVFPRNR